jgi:rod shape-determining protein MreD
VKLTSVVLTILVALVLQVTLARYMVGGRWAFDLVLVGVIFAALQWGPVAGMFAGTMGGLAQDVLAGDVVGIGGLSKTIAGFLSGTIGQQLLLVRPSARAVIVTMATIVHRLLMIGVFALIDQKWPAVGWGAMLAEVIINTSCGLIAFQAAAALPNALERQRMSRRSSLSRRNW